MIDHHPVFLDKATDSRFRQETGVEDILGIARRGNALFYSILAFFVLLSRLQSFISPVRCESVGRLTVDVGYPSTLGSQAELLAKASGVDEATARQTAKGGVTVSH
jgi:hypothetical protein